MSRGLGKLQRSILENLALAPGAAEPLQSGLKYFRDDFERHIHEKRCPWREHGHGVQM